MGLFSSSKPAQVVVEGGSVHINEGAKSPEQRLDRAKGRVSTLTHKLKRLSDGRYNGYDPAVLKASVDNTKKALVEWTKRMKIAEYEIKVTRGDA